MRIGTQRGLSFTVTGTGGVYLVVASGARPCDEGCVPDGVVRPPVRRFFGAMRLFSVGRCTPAENAHLPSEVLNVKAKCLGRLGA